MRKFASFHAFYPYYLQEHQNPRCRAMHYIGSTLVLMLLVWGIISRDWLFFFVLPLVGYGFAWIGHFAFEHNKPATFKYPWYSLIADWVMYKDFLTGQLSAKLTQAKVDTL